MGLRIGERCRRNGSNVVDVDECFTAASRRNDDRAIERPQEPFAEVLHEPGRAQDRVRHPGATQEIELDRPGCDVRGRPFHPVHAQVGDVAHARRFCQIEESRELWGEGGTHHRRHEIDAVRTVDCWLLSARVVPLEVHIAAAAGRCSNRKSQVGQPGGDPGSGLAGAAEYENCVVRVSHVPIVPGQNERINASNNLFDV